MYNIKIIVAVDAIGGFGLKGKIPWYYKEDFAFFRQHTLGEICVMGRNTYSEINQKTGAKGDESVLPGRKCYVLSQTLHHLHNATVIRTMNEVPTRDYFVIGGQTLYNDMLTHAQYIYLTTINKTFNCDRHIDMRYIKAMYHTVATFPSETPELTFQLLERNT